MELTYEICDFNEPSVAGKYVDKPSFERVLSSTAMQEKLANLNTLGTISHEPRETLYKDKSLKHIPASDMLLAEGKAANVVRELFIRDNKLIAKLQVLKSTEDGKKIENLIKVDKVYPNVSMSVQADLINGKYIIYAFNGVDFTFNPALKTKLIDINFSAESESTISDDFNENYKAFLGGSDPTIRGELKLTSAKVIEESDNDNGNEEISNPSDDTSIDGNISDELPVNNADSAFVMDSNVDTSVTPTEDNDVDVNEVIPAESDLTGFSASQADLFNKASMVNFNLVEYVRLRKRSPMLIMNTMIQNTLRYIQSKSVAQLTEEKELILEYLRTYIFSYVSDKINDPSVHQVNLALSLGLNRYVDRKVLFEFQQVANRVSRQLSATHSIDKITQIKLSKSFSVLFDSLIQGILKRVSDKDKVAVFENKSIKPASEVTNETERV